jgi:hypothetical protein
MKGRIAGIVAIALLAGALAAGAAAAEAVPLYDTAEIVLFSSASYNGDAGEPNPFDLDMTAQVTAPSGKSYTVAGFFDGDGAGGAVGQVFKVRVAVDETGTWRWRVASTVPGLDGRAGEFRVQGRLPGSFGRGPIVPSPARPRFFQQQDGGPVFLRGKFLDMTAPSPIQFSHTMFSEKLSDADRQAMLDRNLSLRLNKMNVYLANRGDYGGTSTTPWVGTAAANDKSRFDLRRWHMYEQWVERMRDAGVVAHLWFFADDSGFASLPDADRQRLIRYGMARLSAFVNTMFILTLEWQEGWRAEEVNADGDFLQRNNPWARGVSVHGLTGDFAFPGAPWVDYLDLQAGNFVGHPAVHALGLANRVLAEKPLIQEEFGLGDEIAINRQKSWAAFMAGAAGVGTGAFLAPLAAFTERINFPRMDPADSLVLAGGAYGLAEKGKAYVFYLYEGGSVRVNLRGARGRFAVDWYNPRDGSFHRAAAVQGGRLLTFTAPAPEDWVLYIRK